MQFHMSGKQLKCRVAHAGSSLCVTVGFHSGQSHKMLLETILGPDTVKPEVENRK